jgi:hypothetical protein
MTVQSQAVFNTVVLLLPSAIASDHFDFAVIPVELSHLLHGDESVDQPLLALGRREIFGRAHKFVNKRSTLPAGQTSSNHQGIVA